MQVHYIKYEHVVDGLESESKALTTFLKLDWQSSMLDYQSTTKGRAINTPSAKQVIQPLYKSAQQKYKHFQGKLADSTAFNALAKWSHFWGYDT